ncbi:MAG: hypothetical protein C0631_15595 [Sedimenticola sp.]|uniref:Uncharacterized protein n=2 Tax=Sedimenticola TaxID=349742 RepID=A0A558CLW1_9GAMM|nr:hypothetical protein [Sedimenticola selenatireducens]PLY12880.1 MAG: hypothetical protein C0631_15595 [Sedimenticola sp.]TVO69677.1 hypothetical protein FHP88_17620 [Sedimenticola selenatireducens]TVT49692.1 MAG: hypothetical protein FHK82_16940 [Sedimenticola thiotaurini]TVT62255.1 MAG: hypothetical protein FHK78_15430 [Sedimenticola selenatireducens]
MDNNIDAYSTPSMPLRKAWLFYGLAWLALTGLWLIMGAIEFIAGTNLPGLFILLLIGYLAIGVTLNIKVLRQLVVWHPMYNTIDNTANAKTHMFVLWPFTYPYLFIQMAVSTHLWAQQIPVPCIGHQDMQKAAMNNQALRLWNLNRLILLPYEWSK